MRTRRVVLGATALALLFAGACGQDDKPTVASATTTTSTTAPVVATTSTSALEGPQAYVDSGTYVTGLHIAYITSIDKVNRKITIDVAQFLTGDAATKAYNEDEHTTGPPDNDYYVRNQSSQLRTFDLAKLAEFRVNNLGGYPASDPDGGHQLTYDEFVKLYDDKGEQSTRTLFWISLEDGLATHVEEQFVP